MDFNSVLVLLALLACENTITIKSFELFDIDLRGKQIRRRVVQQIGRLFDRATPAVQPHRQRGGSSPVQGSRTDPRYVRYWGHLGNK